jgi:hypothetical protein
LAGLIVVTQAAFSRSPHITALIQRHIVELAMQVQDALKQLTLFLVWVDSVLVRAIQSETPRCA